MNKIAAHPFIDELNDVLEKTAGKKMPRCEGGLWEFTLGIGNRLYLQTKARLEEGWFLIHAVAPEHGVRPPDEGTCPWTLLKLNARIRGGGKFVILPGDRRPHLRAEIPLDEGKALPRSVERALGGIREAASALHSGHARRDPEKDEGGVPRAAERANGDLEALCQAAGWPYFRRASGRIAIALDVPDGSYRALPEESGDGKLRLSVGLAEAGALPILSRRALGVMLLGISGVVRMGRASALEEDGRSVARFEVVFEDFPSPAELTHALSSLSIACRMGGFEAGALLDEATAGAYLELRGWPPGISKTSTQSKKERGYVSHANA